MQKTLISLLLLICSAASAHPNPPQIISLIPPGHNLENENQIETLCPSSSSQRDACKKEKLAPKTWTLKVYEKPENSSKLLGEIHIVGTPGKGLKAKYIPSKNPALDFPSDSNGTDWGYSCYFEFTVSDVKGDWVQLPKRPFPKPVWINLKNDWPKVADQDLPPEPSQLELGTVYSSDALGKIVFKRFSGDEIVFRKENSNDMLCGEPEKVIQAKDLKETTKPVSTLYDKDGHLIVWPAYCRGC